MAEEAGSTSDFPLQCLGTRKGVYYVMTAGGEIRAIVAQHFTSEGLLDLFAGGIRWLIGNYPLYGATAALGSHFDPLKVTADIIRRCCAAGLVDPKTDDRLKNLVPGLHDKEGV